jgi:hypothetical protein
MNKILFCFLTLFFFVTACNESVEKKPHKLVSRNRMIDMLVDIHLAAAVYQTSHYTNNAIKQYSESDFYYSVLHKYKTADSTFEQSLIYYSSKPKEFEKIYTRVLNRLNEMEQDRVEKRQQPVNSGNVKRE